MAESSDNFFSRWAHRKQQVRAGQPLEEPAPKLAVPEAPVHNAPLVVPPPTAEQPVELPPPPTLQDVQALTPQSDFKRFVAADVDPEVKNAAMKKLFADPHYNVMDGLDTYIDDYNTPDPLPASMLRQMVSAKFLNLFDDEKTDNPGQDKPDVNADTAVAASAAQPVDPIETNHDNADLRLQQDHAPGRESSGRGTE